MEIVNITENFSIFIFSIDICQFSVTALFNSTDDNKSRSISFRSVILIMIYTGTIILNLLAASVDSRFSITGNQLAENSTLASSAMQPSEKDNLVLVAQYVFHSLKLMLFMNIDCRMMKRWSTYGTRFLSHEALALLLAGLWSRR